MNTPTKNPCCDAPATHESATNNNTPSAEVVAALVAHHREFLGFLERRLGDRALAEDLLQDAFSRLDKLSALHQDESAVAWFYRVLRNASIDQARRNQSKSRALEAFASELASGEDAARPDDTKTQVCRCVARLKDTLKPEYRHALEHIELQGTSVKDYAETQGISANNAAVRVFRAREALRKQVALSCGTCAEHGCLDCTCAV